MIHSFYVVKFSCKSLDSTIVGPSPVNSRNWLVLLWNPSVKFHHVFRWILDSSAICSVAGWLSKNTFQWLGVSVINTVSIHCYTMLRVRTFKISCNTSLLDYLWKTLFHGLHLNSNIALFSKSLPVPNLHAYILCKLLIALMGLQLL